MSAILDFADKLRSQIDIVDVVGRYVDLRHAGMNHKGLCPFHREKTPSFTVSQPKQIFHCFGCHEGGDASKLIEKVERLEWIEAVRHLAGQNGIPMPEFRRGDGHSDERQDQKEKLTAACTFAAQHFAQRLQNEVQSGD